MATKILQCTHYANEISVRFDFVCLFTGEKINFYEGLPEFVPIGLLKRICKQVRSEKVTPLRTAVTPMYNKRSQSNDRA
jgi:hypothetical protein